MSCPFTLPAIARDCEGSIGGVKEIYIANKSYMSKTIDSSDTFVQGPDAGTFAIGERLSQDTDRAFRKFIMPRGSAVFGTSAVINRETGANYFENSVTLVLNKIPANGTYSELLRMLTLGEFVVIVRDNNDVAHLIGFGLAGVGVESNHEDGAMATDGSTTTGTAFTDRNGETVTLSAGESAPAPVAAWDDLVAAGFENDLVYNP